MKIDLGKGPGATGAATPTASTRRCWPGCCPTSALLEERDRRPRLGPQRPRGPREYLGARGTRFAIFPGSGLRGKNPAYLMAGELVETGRLWARQNAAIKPEWAERLGDHLVKRSYSEPHWSKKRAAVMAYERVTLYGVPLVTDRLVTFGRVDRALSRELFIRHALVYGEWSDPAPLPRRRTSGCSRRPRSSSTGPAGATSWSTSTPSSTSTTRGSGAEVVSGAHFDQLVEAGAPARGPTCSPSTRRCSPTRPPSEVREDDFPETWQQAEGLTFPISYHFEPGAADDGLTIDVPVATLNRVAADDFSWNVPGVRHELVTSLIRSLPKNLRVTFVPAPDKAREFLAATPPGRSRCSTPSSAGRGRRPASWSRARRGTGRRCRPTSSRPTGSSTTGAPSRRAARTSSRLKAPLQRQFDQALAAVADDSGLRRDRPDRLDLR